jgi:hypothetical protein
LPPWPKTTKCQPNPIFKNTGEFMDGCERSTIQELELWRWKRLTIRNLAEVFRLRAHIEYYFNGIRETPIAFIRRNRNTQR